MSWTGIKKAINRASTQVMVKTGHIEQSHDPEYEHEERRFKQMEKMSLRLHRELQGYLESLRVVSNAQNNIGEALGCFYGPQEGEQYGVLAHEYAATMKSLNESTLPALEAPYAQTVLNPVAKFNSYFAEVNDAIKKRHHKQLDYDALKSKVKKLVETPNNAADSEAKLEESRAHLAEAEQQYNALNTQLKTDLPKLVNLRTPYLDPSFESFVKIQMRFFSDSYDKLNALQGKLDARTREDYLNGRLEKRIDGILERMKDLEVAM